MISFTRDRANAIFAAPARLEAGDPEEA